MSFIVLSRLSDFSEDGEVERFETFDQMYQYLTERLAYWNNFRSDVSLEVKFEKPDPINTLGIVVADETQTTENLS